ncbi:bifunctional folylpolyglutamate synthase/dihydrofolate synthase [Anaerobium acetethylicum]|uniref:bifunctional folylpolyglutamate synthase/dihydrofolate synthase n=1 Tax=Anaerobium acetethylicum TaxID=1619234 RepID=UPI002FE6AA42
MVLNYREAVEYIYEIPKFTSKNDLAFTGMLLERLGSPQENKKVLHVAGTNGKGSVCAYLSSILQTAGKRTGLFTSPHLVDINERFRIDGEPVDDETFLSCFTSVHSVINELMDEGHPHPTFFEVLFAMGMVIFKKEKVEYVILETGLGGRLDATNVIENPLATVITSIGLDHTEILGDTIEKITAEKAGIMKKGVPVIYEGSEEAAEKVILARSEELGSPPYRVAKDNLETERTTNKQVDFWLKCGYYEYVRFHISNIAPYQALNAALAVRTIEAIDGQHEMTAEIVKKGIENAYWPGRMEEVRPGVFLDGAHNEQGIKGFAKTVRGLEGMGSTTLLFSAVMEKNFEEMIRTICMEVPFDRVIVTTLNNKRAVKAEMLAEIFSKYTEREIIVVPAVDEAYEKAEELTDSHGVLFCIGSLYLVGEIKAIIRRKEND